MNSILFCLLAATVIPIQQTDTRIAIAVNNQGQSGIYVASIDGTDARRLTRIRSDLLPNWSPNGQHIAFLSLRKQDYELAAKNDMAFHWFLYVMDADGQHQNRVTTTPIGSIFHWSPDGNRFLFQSSYEDPANRGKDGSVSSAIYVMNSDGSEQTRLTSVDGFDSFPAWSPDGTLIAFCSNRHGNMDIFVMNVDGSEVRQLTHDTANDTSPIWSPNGKQIAFASSRRRQNGSVYLVNSDGTNETWILDDGTPQAWSPDGSRILVSTDSAIFVVGADGNNRKQLTPQDGRALEGVFSPDGTKVFYRWNGSAGSQILSVGVDGEESANVTDLIPGAGFSLSPCEKRD